MLCDKLLSKINNNENNIACEVCVNNLIYNETDKIFSCSINCEKSLLKYFYIHFCIFYTDIDSFKFLHPEGELFIKFNNIQINYPFHIKNLFLNEKTNNEEDLLVYIPININDIIIEKSRRIDILLTLKNIEMLKFRTCEFMFQKFTS